MDELKQKIKEIFVNDLKIQGVKPEDIADDTQLFGDGLGLDSLDAVELVVLIQKHFGVEIANMDEGKEAFVDINTLAKYIKERQ